MSDFERVTLLGVCAIGAIYGWLFRRAYTEGRRAGWENGWDTHRALAGKPEPEPVPDHPEPPPKCTSSS